MTIAGTIYGVVLNDRREQERLAAEFDTPPYGAPPRAPVLYIKPAASVQTLPARIAIPAGEGALVFGATWALQFGTDACRIGPDEVAGRIGGVRLACDVFAPAASYYRPVVNQRARDNSLPLGPLLPFAGLPSIETRIDGEPAHLWTPSDLFRDVASLVSELSQFMTLRAGDLLLLGTAGDAPLAHRGQSVELASTGHPPFCITIEHAS